MTIKTIIVKYAELWFYINLYFLYYKIYVYMWKIDMSVVDVLVTYSDKNIILHKNPWFRLTNMIPTEYKLITCAVFTERPNKYAMSKVTRKINIATCVNFRIRYHTPVLLSLVQKMHIHVIINFEKCTYTYFGV